MMKMNKRNVNQLKRKMIQVEEEDDNKIENEVYFNDL